MSYIDTLENNSNNFNSTSSRNSSDNQNMSVITLNQPIFNLNENNDYDNISNNNQIFHPNFLNYDNTEFNNLDLDNILDINNMSIQDNTNLIINYLPQNVDDSLLKALFIEYGQIESARVVKDKRTKKSSGFGFVKFVNPLDAVNAIQHKNGFSIGNKRLKVSYARPQSDDIKNCKLYVTNLPKEFDEADVRNLFEQFGKIIECRVIKNTQANFHNKGVSFIQFDLRIQAEKALALDGVCLPGQTRKLTVKFTDNYKRQLGSEQQDLFEQSSPNSIPMNHTLGYASNVLGNQIPMGNQLGNQLINQATGNQMSNQLVNQMNNQLGGYLSDTENYRYTMIPDPAVVINNTYNQDIRYNNLPDNQNVIYSNEISRFSNFNDSNQSPIPLTSKHIGMFENDGRYNMIDSNSNNYNSSNSDMINYPIQNKQLTHRLPSNNSILSQQTTNSSFSMNSNSIFQRSRFEMNSSPSISSKSVSSVQSNFTFSSSNTPNYSQANTPSNRSFFDDNTNNNTNSNSNNNTNVNTPMNGLTATLVISNLPTDANISLLYQIFGGYGKVISALVELDPNSSGMNLGLPLCKGKVQMSSFAEANIALKALNGCRFGNNGPPLKITMYSINSNKPNLSNNNNNLF